MGTPSFSVPVLAKLIENDYQVVAVYTKSDKPSGRGRILLPSPVKEMALQYGLHVEEPAGFKDAAVVAHMLSFEPDIIVVASYGHILPKRVLGMPKQGCLNIHPSLLPCYRGPSPVAGAILNGDSRTGVTVMTVIAKVDSGHILAQLKVDIDQEDTTQSLTPKLFQMGAELLIYTIPRWVDGELKPQPQDEDKATYTRTYTKDDGRIDWTTSAIEISRKLRAFTPWPGCYTNWQDRTLKIIEAAPMPETEANYKPGHVIDIDDNDMKAGVVTNSGVLGLRKVQLEGKRPLPISDFLRGQSGLIGSTLI